MDALSLTDKVGLRRSFRDARRQFVTLEGPAASRRLTAHLTRWLGDFARAGEQICSYMPVADEAQADLQPKTQYFFPRLDGERMRFLRPTRADAFKPNAYKIPEPTAGDELSADQPMVVLCPAVAVDTRGGRLGQGKGYYDRFFADHPRAVRVGVVYHVQVAKDPLPAESWDQALDWIVTDKMILRTSNRSL